MSDEDSDLETQQTVQTIKSKRHTVKTTKTYKGLIAQLTDYTRDKRPDLLNEDGSIKLVELDIAFLEQFLGRRYKDNLSMSRLTVRLPSASPLSVVASFDRFLT